MPLSPEELVKPVQAWLDPVSAEKPTGTNARYDPDYEKILGEVGKLEAPTGGAVDWVQVEKLGGGILQKRSKDLLIAAYTGYALFGPKRALVGLLHGMVLLTELLERYWEGLFPDLTRLKARANALGWFLQRATIAFGSIKVSKADSDTVEALLSTSQRLTEVARGKFAGGGPAFGPLLEALERLKLQLPPEAPPAPVPAAASPTAAVQTASAPGVPSSSAPSAPVAPPPPASGEDIDNYLRGVGDGLRTAAANLRHADAADPQAYRLLRTAMWLRVTELPPRDSQGRTSVPPLAPELRTQLETLAANGKFLDLVEESESALEQSPLALDLCRYSARGLASLGPTHDAARKAVLAEVSALLRRLPGVSGLLANDGAPLADGQTRAWMDSETGTSASAGGGGSSGGGVSDDTAAALREAKSLFSSGKSSEGLALLQSKVQSADSGHARFRLRLELAKLCVAANQGALARAMYAALAKECTVHDLDTWEPQLSVECLEGVLSFRPSGALSEEDNAYYQRLCRISPAAAMRIQT